MAVFVADDAGSNAFGSMVTAVPGGAGREAGSISHLELEGRVVQVTQHLPMGKGISPVLQDCVLEILFEQTLGMPHIPAPPPPQTTPNYLPTDVKSTSPQKSKDSVTDTAAASTVSKNGQRVVLRVDGRWAKSAALISVGDILKVCNFTLCEMRQDRKFVGGTAITTTAIQEVRRQPGYEVVVLRGATSKPSPTALVVTPNEQMAKQSSPFGVLDGGGPRATRLIIDEPDETDYLCSDLYVVEPNECTVIKAQRDRTIVMNHYSVGDPLAHDVSPGELRLALGHTMPTTANLFQGFGKYQDILLGQRPIFDHECSFIDRTIGRSNTILDVGCGTGIYSFYLRNSGLFPTLVDPSAAMIDAVVLKNAFYRKLEGPRGVKPELEIFKQDAASMHIPGGKGKDYFRAVLAIRSLPFLLNLRSIEAAVKNISRHMGLSATAIVTALNPELLRRSPKRDQKIHSGLSLDSSRLGYGAAEFPHNHGTADLIEATTILTSAQEAKYYCPEICSATSNLVGEEEKKEETGTGTGLDEGVLRVGTRWIGNAKFTNQCPGTGDNPSSLVQQRRRDDELGIKDIPGLVKLDLPVLQEPTDGAAAFGLAAHLEGGEDGNAPPGGIDSCFVAIEDVTVQLAPNQGFWHRVFANNGLTIKAIYGDLTGCPFEVTRSKEMVFVVTKHHQQPLSLLLTE